MIGLADQISQEIEEAVAAYTIQPLGIPGQ
jgi:hypothetical protein